MAPRLQPFKHVIQWMIAGTRGGINRGRILMALKEMPRNANRLSEHLDLDYRTIRHHLEVLEKNGIVTSMGEHYGKTYFVSQKLEENWEDFEEIWERIGKRKKRGEGR